MMKKILILLIGMTLSSEAVHGHGLKTFQSRTTELDETDIARPIEASEIINNPDKYQVLNAELIDQMHNSIVRTIKLVSIYNTNALDENEGILAVEIIQKLKGYYTCAIVTGNTSEKNMPNILAYIFGLTDDLQHPLIETLDAIRAEMETLQKLTKNLVLDAQEFEKIKERSEQSQP